MRFGFIGTTFREFGWKMLIFFRGSGPDKSKRIVHNIIIPMVAANGRAEWQSCPRLGTVEWADGPAGPPKIWPRGPDRSSAPF
jgi:hypothetical protein